MSDANVTIRLLKKEEIHDAALIAAKAYRKETYGDLARDDLQAMFNPGQVNRPTFLVADMEGELVGFVGYGQDWIDWAVYGICWLTVLPTHQRQGVGRKLLLEAVAGCKADEEEGVVMLATEIPGYFTQHDFRTVQTFQARGKLNRIMILKKERP